MEVQTNACILDNVPIRVDQCSGYDDQNIPYESSSLLVSQCVSGP